MSKKRIELNGNNEKGFREITFSSGAKVHIKPFPTGLYWDLMDKLHTDFSDPPPPKKTIEVVDGTEEVDDFDNEKWKQDCQEAEGKRTEKFALAVMDLCVELTIDDKSLDEEIERFLKYTNAEVPQNQFEKKVFYLEKYAIRSRSDYEEMLLTATEETVIEDPEVSERIKSFQRQVEGSKSSNNDAPSPP